MLDTKTITIPEIEVRSDYDGYFLALVLRWYMRMPKLGLVPKRKKVIITAGPYRSDAVTAQVTPEGELHLDFYSAIRTGFGSLPESDIKSIMENWL